MGDLLARKRTCFSRLSRPIITFPLPLPSTHHPQIIKQGELEKKGQKRRNWKVRWFVLTQQELYYFKNPKDKRSPLAFFFCSSLPSPYLLTRQS